MIHFSHFHAEAANVPAEASPAAAIAAVPPQRTGAAVVRRSARNYKGKWPNFWCRVVMLTFSCNLTPPGSDSTTQTAPEDAIGIASRSSASEVVPGTCAVGFGVSGGRRRSFGWRQGGCGDGRIRPFQGETAGWLPRAGLAVLMWLPTVRAVHPVRHTHSQYDCVAHLLTLGRPRNAPSPTLIC